MEVANRKSNEHRDLFILIACIYGKKYVTRCYEFVGKVNLRDVCQHHKKIG